MQYHRLWAAVSAVQKRHPYSWQRGGYIHYAAGNAAVYGNERRRNWMVRYLRHHFTIAGRRYGNTFSPTACSAGGGRG